MCLGIPGSIESIQADCPLRSGTVRFGGLTRDVVLAYVPEAEVGDYVIVHVGFAISKIDETEAKRVFDYLEEAGELEEIHTP